MFLIEVSITDRRIANDSAPVTDLKFVVFSSKQDYLKKWIHNNVYICCKVTSEIVENYSKISYLSNNRPTENG